MNLIDKNEILPKINSGELKVVIFELGCGPDKRLKNSIAIDMVDLPEVDVVCDLNYGMPFLQNNSVDEIYSEHFLEHINDLGFLMREIYRVLKPGGRKYITVPHFSNPYFYSDYTHKNFFGLYSMSYFSKQDYFKRKVPVFYNDVNFRIISAKYRFKSRWFITGFFTKRFGLFINKFVPLQEYYEAILCYRIPCSELIFIIEKE